MKNWEQARLERMLNPGVLGQIQDTLFGSQKIACAYTDADVREDFLLGRMEVLEATVGAFALGEEWGGEGPVLFLQVSADQILFLCGEWLLDPATTTVENEEIAKEIDERRCFSRLRLERAPSSGLVFGLQWFGSETVKARRVIAIPDYRYLSESWVFSGKLATVERDLRKIPMHEP